MDTDTHQLTPSRRPPGAGPRSRPADEHGSGWRRGVLAGGTDGNERLTGLTGLLLIVLLAVLGVTIVQIGRLLWLHLFLGLVLMGPVALKLASTGYRFVRYYTSDPAYRAKGPPAPALRGLAPLVVLSTLAVFATGVALLLLGPASRNPLGELHKLTFIAWIAFTALHVIGHLPEIIRLLGGARQSRREIMAMRSPSPRHRGGYGAGSPPRPAALRGGSGRRAALSVALLAGLVLAVALLGQYAAWTH